MVFPCDSDSKKSACSAGDPGSIPVFEDPLEKGIFLPGEFHGQKILADYSPWGRKEVDMTERQVYYY